MASDTTHLLRELQTVEENCLYTAQAHFSIAARKSTLVKVVFVGSSAVAALAGGLVAAGLPGWLGVFSAMGGVVGTAAAALGADKDAHAHHVAANVLTRLRHEARALRETFSTDCSKTSLTREVRKITDGYNSLIQGLPATDDEAMRKAREAIQSGLFVPDFQTEARQAKALSPDNVPSEEQSSGAEPG